MKLRKTDRLFRKLVLQLENYTCARCRKPYEPDNCRGLHVSHYWGRGRENTRFDIENVCLLCYGCHLIWAHGDQRDDYKQYMIERLGKEGFDRLEARAYTHKKKDDVLNEVVIKQLLETLRT